MTTKTTNVGLFSVLLLLTTGWGACSRTEQSSSTQPHEVASASHDSSFTSYDSLYALASQYSDTVTIRYAQGLQVHYASDGVHVTITNPDPKAKNHKPTTFVVQSQAQHSKRFICTTALQLGNFEVLGLEKRIVALNSLRHIFSPRMRQQLKEGQTVKIGSEGNFDVEAILATRPDYIFVSASKYGGFEQLRECGIPLIPHHGYKETNPLGQAEWIKLIGLMTGETRRANAVFANIERRYLDLKQHVAQATQGKTLPTVLSGRQLRNGWYVVGGRSYMAQLFHDAGAHYILGDNEESGGLSMDFEKVYMRGIHADFWQTDGAYDGTYTLDVLKAEDARYADIAAFQRKKVLFCNLRSTPYRELGGVEPHLLLADFVRAFHPELLPTYTPKYYALLP